VDSSESLATITARIGTRSSEKSASYIAKARRWWDANRDEAGIRASYMVGVSGSILVGLALLSHEEHRKYPMTTTMRGGLEAAAAYAAARLLTDPTSAYDLVLLARWYWHPNTFKPGKPLTMAEVFGNHFGPGPVGSSQETADRRLKEWRKAKGSKDAMPGRNVSSEELAGRAAAADDLIAAIMGGDA